MAALPNGAAVAGDTGAPVPGAGRTPGMARRVIDFDEPADHPDPAIATFTETTRYGAAFADPWDRAPPEAGRRGG